MGWQSGGGWQALLVSANLSGPTTITGSPVDISNGTSSAALYVYNTKTSASVYERLEMIWVSNVAVIRTAHTGASLRNLELRYSNTTSIGVQVPTAATSPIQIGPVALAGSVAATGRLGVGGAGSTQATSGTHITLRVSDTANPTATSTLVAVPLSVAQTINYSNGTPGAGSYEAIKVAVTETAMPTGQSYMMRLAGGAAGTMDRYGIDRWGNTVFQGSLTKALTAGAATSFVQIDVAASGTVAGYVTYSIHANDSTNFQTRTGILPFVAVNAAGTETGTVATVGTATEVAAVSSGTLTNSFTIATTPTNGVLLQANAQSSLTETTLRINYAIHITDGSSPVITPQ